MQHRAQILKTAAGKNAKQAFSMVLGDIEASHAPHFQTDYVATISWVWMRQLQVHVSEEFPEAEGALWYVDECPSASQ